MSTKIVEHPIAWIMNTPMTSNMAFVGEGLQKEKSSNNVCLLHKGYQFTSLGGVDCERFTTIPFLWKGNGKKV
jgi:hypothetical protein